MGTARNFVVVLGLVGGAVAQQRAELLPCDDVTQRFAADEAQPEGAVQPIARFLFVTSRLLQSEANTGPRGSLVQISTAAQPTRLILRGNADEVALVKSMLEQLRLEDLPRARLQCSFLTMPATLVKAHGLTPGTFAPSDETAFGRLVRDAVKGNGVLQNLPERIVGPLVPFVVEPTAKVGQPRPVAALAMRMRGEMVPVRPGEVAFALQLVRGPLPDDRTKMPNNAAVTCVSRFETGKAVIGITVMGDEATVVFVRCTEVTSDAPKEPKTGR